MTTSNVAKLPNTQENLGRCCGSYNARIIHAAKITSTIILKAKFLPVINGKKSELEIKSAMNGIKKIPRNTIPFEKSFIV